MTEHKTDRKRAEADDRPILFKLAGGYAMVFATIFILYGGVSVVLGFLDRKYNELGDPVMILVYGLLLLIPAMAFREQKIWGYWGLVIVNAAVAVDAAIDYGHYENLIILVFSLAVLTALFVPSTRQYLYKGR